MKHPLFFLFSACAVFAAAPASFLFAGETIPVEINADKYQEDGETASSTVTVITQDDIAESGAAGIVQVLEMVPGIMFRSPLSGPGSEEIVMRGFGENSSGRVLILVDGNRMNNPDMKAINWNAISLTDIERIEILDGSASVQYGNNAVAGVINIITKKSGKTQSGIVLSGGSFWENLESFSHQQSTRWGRFSVSAEHIGSEGYRAREAYDVTNANLQGTVDFNERLSLSVSGSFSDLAYQMPGALGEAQYNEDPRAAVNWADEASEHHVSAGAGLEWIISRFAELKIPFLYRGKFVANDTASWGSFSNRNANSAEAHPLAIFNFDIREMPLNLKLGADLYYAGIDVENYSDPQRNTKTFGYRVDEFNSGYYLLARFNPFKVLNVNAGGRYDFAVMGAKDDAGSMDENTVHHAFVYEAGLAYKPFAPFNVYAKYSTIFRYPFTDEQAEISGFGPPYFNENLEPEQGYNAEGGLSLHFSPWFGLNANVYYMELDDEIAYNLVTFHNENLDKTRRIGTNVSISSNPLSFLELWGCYSFVDAQFIDGPNTGNEIPLVPAHQATGSIAFKLPLNIKIGINVDYRGSSYQGSDYANEAPRIDAYFLLGASVSYTLDKDKQRLMVLLQGSNLMDVSYAPVVFYDSWSGTSSYYPGRGRAFNLSVRYLF